MKNYIKNSIDELLSSNEVNLYNLTVDHEDGITITDEDGQIVFDISNSTIDKFIEQDAEYNAIEEQMVKVCPNWLHYKAFGVKLQILDDVAYELLSEKMSDVSDRIYHEVENIAMGYLQSVSK